MLRVAIQKTIPAGYIFTNEMLSTQESVEFVDEKTGQLVAALMPGHFEIAATDAILLSGVHLKGKLIAKDIKKTIKLTNGCNIDGGYLQAGKEIIIEGENSDLKEVTFKTSHLKIEGGSSEATALCVTKSQFTVDYFDQTGYVVLSEKSYFKCKHVERVSTINGRVALIDSAIETDGLLHVTENAVVEVKGTQRENNQAQEAAPDARVRFVAQAGVTAEKGMIVDGMMLLSYKAALKSKFLKLTNALLELKDNAAAFIEQAVTGLNEIIRIDGASQLQAQDLFVSRKLRAKLGAKVLVAETVDIAPTADFKGKSASIQAKKVLAKGPIKLIDMRVKTHDFVTSGQYAASGGVVDTVRFTATFTSQLKSDKKHVISTSEYITQGDTTQNDSFVKLKKYPRTEQIITKPFALFSKKAFTELKGESGIIGGEVYSMASLKVVTTTEKKDKKKRKKFPTITGNKIILLSDSVVYGEDLLLRSEHVNQDIDSIVSLKGMLSGEGTRFISNGYIHGKSVTLGYDKLVKFKSFAIIQSKQLDVSTARYSSNGLVAANSFQVNAFLYDNSGILLIHTATVNALISRTGVVLATNSGDNLFSLKNLQGGIAATTKALFPGYKNIVDLVFSGIGTGQSIYQLVNLCKQYAEYKDLRLHQVIKMIVQVKDVLSSGVNFAKAGYGALKEGEFVKLPQDIEKNFPLIVAKETWRLPSVKKIGLHMLSAGMHGAQQYLRSADGGYNETSLLFSEDAVVFHPNIDITSSIMLPSIQVGVNVSNMALTRVSGVAFAGDTLSVTALTNTNLFLQSAPHLEIMAFYNETPGIQQGLLSLDYKVVHTDVPKSGTFYARNPSAKGISMNVDGKLDVGGQGTIEMSKGISGEGVIHYRDHVKFKVGERTFRGQIIGATTPEAQAVAEGIKPEKEQKQKQQGEEQQPAVEQKTQEDKSPAENPPVETKPKKKNPKRKRGPKPHNHKKKKGEVVDTQTTEPEIPPEPVQPQSEVKPEQSQQPEPQPQEQPVAVTIQPHIYDWEIAGEIVICTESGGDIHFLTGPPDKETGERTKCKKITYTKESQAHFKEGVILTEELVFTDVDTNNLVIFENMRGEVGTIVFPAELRPVFIGLNYFVVLNKLHDLSLLGVRGAVIFDMSQGDGEREYIHDGKIYRYKPEGAADDKEITSVFQVIMAKKGALNGEADVDEGYISFENFPDFMDFLHNEGKYKGKYNFTRKTHVGTKDLELKLDKKIDRPGDISVEAASVDCQLPPEEHTRRLTLKSNKEDVKVSKTFKGMSLTIESAGKILINVPIELAEHFQFKAGGEMYYLGALVNAENIVGEAGGGIYVVTAGSEFAKTNPVPMPIGKGGEITGRKFVSMTALKGNIENHGAKIKAGDTLFLVAENGDVIGIANEYVREGKYDTIKKYVPALFGGGSGASNNNVGLIIHAHGKFRLKASHLISEGINQISAKQGVEGVAEHHTFVAYEHHDKNWFKEKYEVSTMTTVCPSVISSTRNYTIIVSEQGGLYSVATQFLGPVRVYTEKDALFYSLKYSNQDYKYKSSWFGLKSDEKDKIRQKSMPSLLLDDVASHIEVKTGNVDFSGALIIGQGHFTAITHDINGKIIFGRDILNHEFYSHHSGPTLSLPGMGFYRSMTGGGDLLQALASEHSTFAKLYNLTQSRSVVERAASAGNLGISVYNQLATDFKYQPAVGVGFSDSTQDVQFQTLADGGLRRGGDLTLHAPGGVVLNNEVTAAGDAMIHTPQIELHAAELKTTVKQSESSMNISMSLAGGKPEVGASTSQSSVSSTQHVAAQLNIGGNLDLQHESGKVTMILDGGTVKAKSGSGVEVEVDSRDKQHIVDTERFSMGVSTSGQFSVYKGSGKDAVTDVKSSISAPGLNVSKVTKTTPEEKHGYRGFGVAGNVSDITSRAEAPSPAISTVSLTLDVAEKHVSVDLPLPRPHDRKTPQSVIPSELPAAEEKKQEVELSSSPEAVKDEPVKYVATDLAPLQEAFEQRAQEVEASLTRLEGELLLAVAQGVNREAEPIPAPIPVQSIKPSTPDVTHSELKQAEDQFKSEHPQLYRLMNPENDDAFTEFFDTPPVGESIVNAAVGAARMF